MKSRWQLEGKNALITGGTRGIGRAIAEEFVSLGAKVCLVARNIDPAHELVERWNREGCEAIAIQADLSRAEDRQTLCAELAKKWSRLDILINNSGINILVVYKKRMLFCIFSCTNSVRQFILSAWLLKLLIVGTVEVKISLNLARRPTINSATAAMIVVNKAAKTPQ